jgi:hypothetical protein
MATVGRGGAVRLRGRPGALTGPLALPESAAAIGTVKLALGAATPTPVTAHVVRIGAKGLSNLRLDLPRWTPPGSYEGVLQLGDEEQRVVIDVEPRPKLRMSPRRLSLTGRPKDVVKASVTLANVGNVPCEVRGVAVFALFDPSSLERATQRAFQSSGSGEERFLDRLAAEVSDGYAGTVRLKVESGAGQLEPGDSRDLEVTLNLPDGLKAGRTYEGTWRIGNLGYNVEVSTPNGTPPEEKIR